MLKSSIAAVPVVLTVTAGTSHAQGMDSTGVMYSASPMNDSLEPDEDVLLDEGDEKLRSLNGIEFDHSLEESLENGGFGETFGDNVPGFDDF